jgi:hypothetical protein
MEANNNPEQSQPTHSQSSIGIAAFISGGLSLCTLLSYLVFIYSFLISTSRGTAR